MTHVEALKLSELPDRLILVGGGYIGMEMAQASVGSAAALSCAAEGSVPSRRARLGWSARLVARRQEEGEVTEVRATPAVLAAAMSTWR